MKPIREPIVGKEEQGQLTTPDQAIVQFYCAFNSGNLEKMSEKRRNQIRLPWTTHWVE
jgi:hypothetical protein